MIATINQNPFKVHGNTLVEKYNFVQDAFIGFRMHGKDQAVQMLYLKNLNDHIEVAKRTEFQESQALLKDLLKLKDRLMAA